MYHAFYYNKRAFCSTFNEGFAFKGSGQYVSSWCTACKIFIWCDERGICHITEYEWKRQGNAGRFQLSIIETLNNSGFDAQKYFKDVVEYNIYNTGLTVKDTIGDINTDDYQFMADTIMPVMTIGDYNSVARLMVIVRMNLMTMNIL